MSLFSRLFTVRPEPKLALQPLYNAIVVRGREPHWYVEGAVPDTLDGRFDMIAAVLTVVLLRLEESNLRHESVWLTELFIDDMEGQLRQIGIGDIVVGKHVGRMMSALGGRLSAYRAALEPAAAPDDFVEALERNLYRGEKVARPAVAHVAARLRAMAVSLADRPAEALLAGALPE
jgi:cytochrome b pre-mRNA-processing protein 3